MQIAVPKEIREGEKRVALVPDVINKLTKLGLEVVMLKVMYSRALM
jgi:NAD(P) transhydrogenase subunit alpha